MLGRYPMHFHLLGDCPTCYVKDSSFHKSFYRCISVHGTNNSVVAENVAYDVKGYCYYLEDGVEENNSIEFNLAAHIHNIGPDQPGGGSQRTDSVYVESPDLVLPADATASGYYITNIHNNIVGNAASGVSAILGLFSIQPLTAFLAKQRDGLDLHSQFLNKGYRHSRTILIVLPQSLV